MALKPYMGFFPVNDLQTPPSKRADSKIFLAYVSDDFKTKKMFVKKKIIFIFVINLFFRFQKYFSSIYIFQTIPRQIFFKDFYFYGRGF